LGFNDVGSQQPVAGNNLKRVSSSPFQLQGGIEETVSPGIICIICHQILPHPSEHGTSSMQKQLLPKSLIAKLNELPDSEVSELTYWMVNQPALLILKSQGS
jgi:hypothetical protein